MSEKEKLEIEAIEKTIKENSVFNDGKLIHGGRRNAIVFSRTGDIGVFADGIKGIKILKAKDIKSLKYLKTKDEFGNKEWYCVLGVNDFDNPIIKIRLAFDEEGDAGEKFENIKQLYTLLKQSVK